MKTKRCKEQLVINGRELPCEMDRGHKGNHFSGGISAGTKEVHYIEWEVEDGKTVLVIDFPMYVYLFLASMEQKVGAIHFLSDLLYDELKKLEEPF